MTNLLQIKDPSGAVQRAIYKALNQYIIGIPIYDTPPTGSARPYIVIGEGYTVKNNTKDIPGRRVFMTIHAWSDKPSFLEVKAITEQIVNILSAGDLSPNTGQDGDDFVFLITEVEKTDHYTDEDGKTKHGTVEIVIETQKK